MRISSARVVAPVIHTISSRTCSIARRVAVRVAYDRLGRVKLGLQQFPPVQA